MPARMEVIEEEKKLRPLELIVISDSQDIRNLHLAVIRTVELLVHRIQGAKLVLIGSMYECRTYCQENVFSLLIGSLMHVIGFTGCETELMGCR